jgi:hypothetical protein
LILDRLLRLWRPATVLKNLLKLPDSFLDVWLRGQKVLNMMHSDIPVAGLRRLIKKLPQNPEISVLHLPGNVMKTAKPSETVDLLNAVDDVVHRMPNLRVFGVHGLHLRSEHILVLVRMLSALRWKLTGLSLCLQDWKFGGFHEKRYLLETIGKLRKLKMLVFPKLEAFVANDPDLVQLLASAQQCTVVVRGEPSMKLLVVVTVMAYNLEIVSAPFEG